MNHTHIGHAEWQATVGKRRVRSLSERIADADAKGSDILARANEAAEAGDKAKAEKLYERGQKWLDESNRLRGCD